MLSCGDDVNLFRFSGVSLWYGSSLVVYLQPRLKKSTSPLLPESTHLPVTCSPDHRPSPLGATPISPTLDSPCRSLSSISAPPPPTIQKTLIVPSTSTTKETPAQSHSSGLILENASSTTLGVRNSPVLAAAAAAGLV